MSGMSGDSQGVGNIHLAKLVQFVFDTPRLRREFETARAGFPSLPTGNMAEAMVMDWFIFDYKLKGLDKTPLEYFIDSNRDMPAAEQKIYEALRMNIYSIFEVRAIKVGKEIILRDLATEKEYWVWEKMATKSLRKGQCIFARVIPFRDHYILAGGGHLFPDEAIYTIKLRYKMMRDRKVDMRLSPKQMAEIFSGSKDEKPEEMDLETLEERIREKLEEAGLSDTTLIEILDKFNKVNEPSDVIREITQKAVFPDYKDADQLLDLLNALWNKMPHESMGGLSPEERRKQFVRGPQEQDMLKEMAAHLEAMINPNRYRSRKDINNVIAIAQKEWLDTKSPELDGKSPREVILEERQRLGNQEKEILITVSARPISITTRKQKEAKELYHAALELIKDGCYADAIEKYKRYIELSDKNHVVWGNMGAMYARLGNVKEALRCLHRSLSLKPDYKIARKNLELYGRKTKAELKKMAKDG
ncbi:MAG: tetratricopeptide repeat protein [Candidatus Aureabacteria bacterium]|nr:tetratricopeptide repeat protein [Candidatus Auribacterota bacterium]